MTLNLAKARSHEMLETQQQSIAEAENQRNLITGIIIFTVMMVIIFGILFFFVDLSFSGASFYAYAATTAINAIIELLYIWKLQRRWKENLRYGIFTLIAKASGKSGTIQKIRGILWIIFRIVNQWLVWPFVSIAKLVNKSTPDFEDPFSTIAMAELQRIDAILSTTIAFLSFVFLMIYDTAVPGNTYFQLIIWIVLLHVLCRHLGYLMNTFPLQVNLRRTIGNPYFQFITVALCDLLVLCLAFGALGNYFAGNEISIKGIVLLGKKMLSIKDTWELIEGGNEPPIRYLMSFSGILYYTNIAKVLIHFKEFKRQDEDFITIANRYLLAGKFREALQWLEKINNQDIQASTAMALANLGLGKIERAFRYIKKTITADQHVDIDDQAIFKLFNSIVQIAVPKSSYLSLIEHAAAVGVSDATLSLGVRMFFQIYAAADPEELDKILKIIENNGGMAQNPLTFQICVLLQILSEINIFDDDQLADEVMDEEFEKYHLGVKNILAALNEIEPEKNRDLIVKAVTLIVCLNLTIEEELLSEESIADIKTRLSELVNLSSELQNDWERLFALQIIESLIPVFNEDPEIMDAILDVMSQIRETIEDTKLEIFLKRGAQIMYQQSAS